MNSFSYAFHSLIRVKSRSLAYLLGLSLAVALFSGTLFFIDGSARSMTQRAIAPVRLDFQTRALDAKTDVTQFATQLQGQRGVKAVRPFVAASINVVAPTTVSSSSVSPTPAGNAPNLAARLFAVPLDYPSVFPLLSLTTGRFEVGSVCISEQLALTLHLKAGDTLQLLVPGLTQPYSIKVSGTLNTDLADPLFAGPKAAPEGSYNFAGAVVLLDTLTFNRDLSGPLQLASEQAQATPNSNPLPGATNTNGLPLLDRQLHVNIERSNLPSDPAEAQLAVGTLRRNLERQLSGQLKITDNLSATLTGAIGDAVAARLLFIFLGLPGILLAIYLSRNAAQLVIEAQRREVALLRARGIGPHQMLLVMGWTAFLIALGGTGLGLVLGAASTTAIFGTSVFKNASGLGLSALYALGLGLVLGGVGVFLPARQMLAGEINEERRSLSVSQRPLWLRLPLDLALLAVAGGALWFSGSYNSKTANAGASETAAVSLGIYSFIGPLLFWFGAALFFRRILDWVLSRRLPAWTGGLNGLAVRSLRRRRPQSAGVALLIALALSFGVATTIFGASYEASRQAEARYFVGSDLKVTLALTNPQPASFAEGLRAEAGVGAVAPVWVANDVLVGSQAQVVYGIDTATFKAATTLPDSFFVSDSTKTVMDRLATTPDGLLVSSELANSYNIVVGDMVSMRIPVTDSVNAANSYYDARLQVVGIFNLFPTSSQNSDLVVNSAYLTKASHNLTAGFFLIKTDGTATSNNQLAASLAEHFKAQSLAARIETANRVISGDQSSLTGLNLSGLLTIDRFYSALIMAIGVGVFLLGNILARQRELGTLEAIGATRSQVTGLLLIEGAVLVAWGTGGGLVIGLLLAWQYTGFLGGIFAVSLPTLSIPLLELSGLLGLGLVGAIAAALIITLRLRHLWPAQVLRES